MVIFKKKEILNPWIRSDGYPVPQSIWDDFSVKDANKIRIHLKEVFKKIGQKYGILHIPPKVVDTFLGKFQ